MASKWISGFCSIGCHEGTMPTNVNDVPLKVCVVIGNGPNDKDRCSCKCHKEIDRMFESVGLPRVPKQSPLWKPTPSPDLSWLYEDSQDPMTASVSAASQGRAAVAEPVRDHGIPVEPAPSATDERTPSGYRRKGQLEYAVNEVCTGYLKGNYNADENGDMTTKHIAYLIDPDEPPSPGAVQSVLERWEKLGYAEMRRKPVGFQMLTIDGMQKGLHKMQDEAKIKRRMDRKKMRTTNRGFRG